MTDRERRAPIQGDYWLRRGTPGRESGSISWTEHLEAWGAYSKKYTGQSAEAIAARGGFGYQELVGLLGRVPKTFEPNVKPLPPPPQR